MAERVAVDSEPDSATLPRPRPRFGNAEPDDADTHVDTDAPAPRPRWQKVLLDPGAIAILTFAVATPLAFLIPRLAPGGIGPRTAGLPMALGALAGGVLFFLGRRRAPGWLAGTVAGTAGAWIVLILATMMRGTPFPMYGFIGDAGRIAAMATRYSVTAGSADPWIKGVPGEYPPLFPWLIGRTAALTGEPAWSLVGRFEMLFTGACLVAGFALWQRLVKPWTALAITVLSFAFLSFAVVAKSYEALTLMAFIPWAVLTFGRPQRGRLHWTVAGAVGAFILLTYYGWLILGGLGLLVLAVMTWRHETDRRAYLMHLLKTGAVTLVLSAWFVGPLLQAKLTVSGENVTDLYGTSSLLDAVFPFFDLTWSGALQLVGLIGLIWLRGRQWWAWPLLALVIGAYLFRALGAITFVLTNHTLIAHYTPRLYSAVLVAAGVLTIVHAVPRLIERLSLTPPKRGLALAMAILVGWMGYAFTVDWTPNLWGRYRDYAERAYREPLPDGRYVSDLSQPTPWFPVGPIQTAVEGVLGTQARPVALSTDERLWSFLPWYGYLGNSTAASSMAQPFERLSEVERLARVTDPTAFARESAQTRFGPIDVFILQRKDATTWTWTFEKGFGQPSVVATFGPQQFAAADWVVVDNLPQNVVVAIRKK